MGDEAESDVALSARKLLARKTADARPAAGSECRCDGGDKPLHHLRRRPHNRRDVHVRLPSHCSWPLPLPASRAPGASWGSPLAPQGLLGLLRGLLTLPGAFPWLPRASWGLLGFCWASWGPCSGPRSLSASASASSLLSSSSLPHAPRGPRTPLTGTVYRF
mgnify:CR=1 FL=1